MELSAPVGLLLSRVNHATVYDLIQTNQILKQAKARKSQKIWIHPIPLDQLMVVAWVDASHANREDGSSTKGILVGCASKKILPGDLESITPIYWTSSKIMTVCRSSASAETRAAVDGEDQLYAIPFQ